MQLELTGDVITYTNCVWPESGEIATREDAPNMLFAGWDSYSLGMKEFLYAEFEIMYPLSAEEVEAINAALTACFTKPQ